MSTLALLLRGFAILANTIFLNISTLHLFLAGFLITLLNPSSSNNDPYTSCIPFITRCSSDGIVY